MAHITSFKTRLSRSARGELYNPLIYPFLLVTLAYGIGFTAYSFFEVPGESSSSLFAAMVTVSPALTAVWGLLSIIVILVGFYVLVMNKPPVGKANCFVAWSLWLFASLVYILTGGFIPLFAVALPSLYFWTWQYFSLARFRAEDRRDNATMERYNDGQYDRNRAGRKSRLKNRGVDADDRDARN